MTTLNTAERLIARHVAAKGGYDGRSAEAMVADVKTRGPASPHQHESAAVNDASGRMAA